MANQRDSRILTETVRRSEIQPTFPPTSRPSKSLPLPRIGRSDKTLAAYEHGFFTLYKNKPNELELSSKKQTAYAACAIANATDCVLHRCSGESSGGFWLAVPCQPGQEPVEAEKCINIDDGQFPLPSILIDGLQNTATEPQFNGWAAEANGTFRMEMLFPPVPTGPDLVDFVQCNPVVRIQVPNNQRTSGNRSYPTGPLQIQWSTDIPIALYVSGGTRTLANQFGRDIVTAQLNENGANPYPRDAGNNKLVAGSEYSDWRGSAAGGGGLGDADFLSWLSNGTFTIYPST